MPFLALADVRQTTCHPPSPPRALPFGIIPACQVLFFPPFHSSRQGEERLSQEPLSHCAGVGASVQVGGVKNCGDFEAFTTHEGDKATALESESALCISEELPARH